MNLFFNLFVILVSVHAFGVTMDCIYSSSDLSCKTLTNFEKDDFATDVNGIPPRGEVEVFEIPPESKTLYIPSNSCEVFTTKKIFVFGSNVAEITRNIFQGCVNVTVAKIEGTIIYWLPEDTFEYLPKLLDLSLNRNRLKILPMNLLLKNVHLRTFNASNNQLEQIDLHFSIHVESVDLAGNTCINASSLHMTLDKLNTKIKEKCESTKTRELREIIKDVLSKLSECERSNDYGSSGAFENESSGDYESTTIKSSDKTSDKPVISMSSDSQFFASEDRLFWLECDVKSSSKIVAVNITSSRNEMNDHTMMSNLNFSDDGKNARLRLTVTKGNKHRDEGNYTCIAEDLNQTKASTTASITFVENPFIEVNTTTKIVNVIENNGSAKFSFEFSSYPSPTFTLLNPLNELVTVGDKYQITSSNGTLELFINDPRVEVDAGTYTIISRAAGKQFVITVKLIISGKPYIIIDELPTNPGNDSLMTCKVFSYATANMSLLFQPCDDLNLWPNCSYPNVNSTKSIEVTNDNSYEAHVSRERFQSDKPGFVHCTAENEFGNRTVMKPVYFSDFHLLSFKLINDWGDRKIAEGEQAELICIASVYNYTNNLTLYKDGEENEDARNYQVEPRSAKYSWRKAVVWKEITKNDSGVYKCEAFNKLSKLQETQEFSIYVYDAKAPIILSNFNDSRLQLGDSLVLECLAEGLPLPQLVWYKDDEVLNVTRSVRDNFIIHESMSIPTDNVNSTIEIMFFKQEDIGNYECRASSGNVTTAKALRLDIAPSHKTRDIIIVFSVIAILTCFAVFILVKFLREKQLTRELKAAGLANFEEGNLECLNPDLNLDEQADLLPYDKNYEFPIEKLTLGKQLGAGAFGVVVEATAQNILPDEEITKVAVKMVKKMSDNQVMRALVMELKIMIHIGPHANIVNLLGAVTQNISQRELLIIVELCPFGNLQSFLINNKDNFVDQIQDGLINTSIQYTEPENVTSNVPLNQEPESGYQPFLANKNQGISFTTSDLIFWSLQVARGMNYLVSKKVLHGDLAARNVLLCQDNVVKICDFGLARSLYKNEDYTKTGESLLPFKWLALESIQNNVFNVYSDVWSFGIMLWELFTLGTTPYPGMAAGPELYEKILNGYRMDKPDFATQEIFDIMLSCWKVDPSGRPLFRELDNSLSSLLHGDMKIVFK